MHAATANKQIIACPDSHAPLVRALWACSSAALLIVAQPQAALGQADPPRAAQAGSRVTSPPCDTLVTWGGSIDPRDTYRLAPRVAAPGAFQEPGFSELFGIPGLARFAILMHSDGCQQFANLEPEKIPAAARPYWLQCVLQIAGMGERGRQGPPNGSR